MPLISWLFVMANTQFLLNIFHSPWTEHNLNGSISWISSNCGCYTYSHYPFKYVVDHQPESIHHHFHLEIVQHTSFSDYFPHPTLQLVAADLTCKTSFLTNINWLHLSIVLMQNLHDLTFWMIDYVIFYVHCIFR